MKILCVVGVLMIPILILCPYCPNKKTYQTANLRICVYELKKTVEISSTQILSSTNGDININSPELIPIFVKNVVYISPLTLRKELEYTIEQNGISFLMSVVFPEKYPLLFWNLLWFFRRKCLKTHLSLLLSSHLKRCYKTKISISPSWERIYDEIDDNKPIKLLLSSRLILSSICNENPSNAIEKMLNNVLQSANENVPIKKIIKQMYTIMELQHSMNIPISWNLYSETLHILDFINAQSSTSSNILEHYDKIYAKFFQKYTLKITSPLKQYMEPPNFCAIKLRNIMGPLHVITHPN